MSTDSNAPATTSPNEIPCPECGEAVRKQLIRCWNCGAFMHKKLEERYQQMQANPAPIIFSLPEGEAVVADEESEGDDMGFVLAGSPPGNQTETEPGIPLAKESSSEKAGSTAEQKASSRPTDDVPATPHSIATGGDALLDIALKEEAESQKRRKKRRPLVGGAKTPGGFIIFCPYGCHIEVKEQHRGMTGKCPKCQAPFIVPTGPPQYVKKEEEPAEETRAAISVHWMDDLHLHVVNPEKLKLKADSLLKDFVEADVGFTSEGMLVATLQKKASGGLFGSGGDARKKPETREAIRKHITEGKPAGELPAGEGLLYPTESLSQLRVVQPVQNRAASLFAGIPVFGEWRIAVQLPILDDKADPRYLSMGLLQFREFTRFLEEHFGIKDLDRESGLPREESYQDYKCHYMDVPIRALKNLEWYKADPTANLTIAGYRCGACGLAVCEAARNKEKLGGKGGKGIAKVKCPKCTQKMGEHPLYSLAAAVSQPSLSGEDQPTAAEEAAAGT